MDPNTPDDIEMTPPSTAPPFAETAHELDDDDSMPELQDISDSSDDDSDSDRDADEVEMQTVDLLDDPTPSRGLPLPRFPVLQPSFSRPMQSRQTSGVRRTRVEDDDDDERDRRHPSQRINQPGRTSSASSSSGAAPQPQQRHNIPPTPIFPPPPPPQAHQPNPGIFEPWNFMQQFMSQPGAAPTNHQQPPPAGDGQHPLPGGGLLGGFAVTIDLSNGRPVILNSRQMGMHNIPIPGLNPQPTAPGPNPQPQANAPPGFQDAPDAPLPGNGPPAGGARAEVNFGEILERLGILGALFGRGEREQEDPERAKKLVEGLDEVPIGLVRRLERVGLGNEDGVGVTGGDGGCAVCWDRLLDPESEGFGHEGEEDPSVASTSSPPTESKSCPRIVALPCAHVFHASCLIPWFSRPNQTTCPTCRFNIDPENLTLRRRRRRFSAMEPLGDDFNIPIGTEDVGLEPLPPVPDILQEFIENQNLPRESDAESTISTGLLTLSLEDPAAQADGQGAHQHHGPLPAAADLQNGPADPADPPTGQRPDGARRGTRGFVTIGIDVFLGRAAGDEVDGIDDITLNGIPQRTDATPVANGPAGANTANAPRQNDQDAQEPGQDGQNNDEPPAPPLRMFEMFGEVLSQLFNPGSQMPTPGTNVPNRDAPTPAAGVANPTPTDGGAQANVHAHQPTGPGPNIQVHTLPPPAFGNQPGPRPAGVPRPTLPPFAHLFAGFRQGGLGTPTPGAGAPGGANAAGGDQGPPSIPFAALFGSFVPRDRRAPQPQENNAAPRNTQPAAPRSASEPPVGLASQPATPAEATGAPVAEGANQNVDQNQNQDTDNTLPPFDRFLTDILGFPMGMNQQPQGPRPPFNFHPLQQNQPRPAGPPRPRPSREAREAREAREKKEWTLPPAPGPTLRERVERKEREAGLRCHDMSCGIGPSDDDPYVDDTTGLMKQLSIRLLVDIQNDDGTARTVCQHKFHPACLVSAERVSLMGTDVGVVGGDVEVSCSVCRGHGKVSHEEWAEGEEALR